MWFRISVVSFVFLLMGITLFADSMWNATQPSLYSTMRSTKVGEVITIYISESTDAAQGAGTKTSKESNIDGNILSSWDQVARALGTGDAMRKEYQLKAGGGDTYNGQGQTTRTSKVKAVISAVVSDILDNGNLYIVGDHQVRVNDEAETIHISGIVRPADISPENTVYSYQIAKADVSVKGSGVVGSKQTPGILTRLFGWLF